jgi:hypothetical protein
MGVRVAQSLVFCDVFCRSIIVLFRLTIALSVLRIMASDNPFDIFKLFLSTRQGIITSWKSCFLWSPRHVLLSSFAHLSLLYFDICTDILLRLGSSI